METKLIVLEPAYNLRALGRAALRGNWQKAIFAMLILMALLDLVGSIIDALLSTTYTLAPGMDFSITFSWIYQLAILGAMNVGMAVFFIKLFRHQETKIGNVFAGFEYFGKAFTLGLLIEIFVILWSLLFIVPGIIAYMRYSQAYYIMQDRPELSAMDCIRESKRMMVGNKMKYFSMTLSFIGWAVLALTPVIIYEIGVSISQLSSYIVSESSIMPDVSFGPIDYIIITVLSMGLSIVGAYNNATCAAFYELLNGNLSGKVFEFNKNLSAGAIA